MTPPGGAPTRVLLADAGDAVADAIAEALAQRSALDLARLTPHLDPTGVSAADPADPAPPPLDAPRLVLVPRRTSRGRLPAEGRPTAADRHLIALAHRWAAGRAAGAPAAGSSPTARLVLVASALVHEPSHRHPGHVGEDAPPRRPPANRVSRRWRGVERAVHEIAEETGVELVTLRPAPVVGTGGDGVLDRLFGARVAFVPAGYDPPVQPLPLGELVAALTAALDGRLGAGTWHVAPDGVEPLRIALRRAGTLRVPVPTVLLRTARRLAGGEPDEIEALRYPVTVSDAARRRATGDRPPATLERPAAELAHDPFSFERGYVDRYGRTLFRFLHDAWWRIEWRGLERVPRDGGAVLVANHRGHQPWDGVMLLHRLARELGRYPRFLIHPALVKLPFLTPYLSRLGGIHACRENGDWVLEQDELLAVFPEGIRGAFRRYRRAHTLVPFRPDYVRFALRHRVPIVPIVVLGSAEIFPILGTLKWRWWRRVSEWPSLPITPTMSLVPLPSKWHIQVLEPLDPAADSAADPAVHHGPEAADDPAVYRRIDREVQRRMAAALETMLGRRRHIFFGSIFDGESV